MQDKYVTWREWAASQVSIAVLTERLTNVQHDVRHLMDRVDHLEAPPVHSLDWKWWGQILMILTAIGFLVLANTNEDLAREILATIRAGLER